MVFQKTDQMRTCIATGKTAEKTGFIRFALAPDHVLYVDLVEKLPGRGLWVSANAEAVRAAFQKKAFHKAARAQIRPLDQMDADGYVDHITQSLVRQICQNLSLARRAGHAICGMDKVSPLLNKHIANLTKEINQYDCKLPQDGALNDSIDPYFDDFLYLLASDAGKDAKKHYNAIQKLVSAQKLAGAGDDLPLYAADFLTSNEMAGVFSKAHAIHVLVKKGGLLNKIRRDLIRLAGFKR
ncbi:MAG: DUF448 domain-containing protein [Alphaproteobacteria bacterium]